MGPARPTAWRQALRAAIYLVSSVSLNNSGQRVVRCDSGAKSNAAAWKNTKRALPPAAVSGNNEPSPSNLDSDQQPKDMVEQLEKNVKEAVSAWDSLTERLGIAHNYFESTEWPEIIKNYLAPDWSAILPGTIQNLQRELSMAPGSLADDVWKEACDPTLNPEIATEATVRIGEGLCPEEQEFRHRRSYFTARSLALYLDLPIDDVHPDDVPVIALCGSGGGLRALVAGTGSYLAAKEAGLWDCAMYTAGVSGSCWLQTIYNTSLGKQDFQQILLHLKSRLGIHIADPPEALSLLTTPPTNKYLMRGFVEQLKGDPNSDFGVVDIYGILLAARLMVSDGDGLVDSDLKLSSQRSIAETGLHPLPIYTAVRHEIPELRTKPDEAKETARGKDWFQWFEFSPYELFCEEISAGIPSWAAGRHFDGGKDTPAQVEGHAHTMPELKIPALMGVWGSAFCATLAHYYKEIRPVLKGLAGFESLDTLVEGKNKDLYRVHPIGPATIPNFALGLGDSLPSSCPKSLLEEKYLRLMDAGMSNNLPIYPLLRSERKVDLIVAFDASADVKEDNWLSEVDGYARQRRIVGWPMGSGWPKSTTTPQETADVLQEEQQATKETADLKVAAAASQSIDSESGDLSYCNIWVGTTAEKISTNEPPTPTRLFNLPPENDKDSESRLMEPDAGIAVVYFPLLANPSASIRSQLSDPGGEVVALPDPASDDFMSTWNFIYTPEQIDSVVQLAKVNFAEGEDQLKRVVRGIYERKKRERIKNNLGADRESVSYLS
ncbi:hypothetical protein FQN57_003612 [Myotisia sp. PD_48]|nr:hypothetical protein FQN57_003612 [Myotisia sp. PD_48]